MMGTNVNPLSNPADQEWQEKFNKFNMIVLSMVKTMDSFRLTDEILKNPLYKDSQLIKKILNAYKKTSQRNCKFFEGLLKDFKTFNFIIPSMRKENQIKTIPGFVI